MVKKCKKCNEVKELTLFKKSKLCNGGYTHSCLKCISLYHSENYKKNKEKILKVNKLWWERNKEIHRKKVRQHSFVYDKQPEVKEKRNKRNFNRKKIDPQFKLAHNLRTRIRNVIKNNKKMGSAVKDLGCTLGELKVYLESKFQPGMNWENYGKYGWHIDHIIPLSKIDLTIKENFLKAIHYTNLQPLWCEDNYKKGNKMELNKKDGKNEE